ncbi:Integrase catalytic region [Cellulomonas fimi ATCC 484]|uniref:Integrase catalytic region n=2 Tax=Cellulomonas fimi TaxID=1708 RepID=F4H835_CELFA|nr:Integrase catalytic region [Cellulomonas fimi ATCC 484]VEH34800.1 Transposase and inactivated derivatives [Cellulomonas fimi]
MTVEDWAEIRRLHRVDGMAIKAIARRLGVSRNAVRRALARDAPPRYERAAKGSLVDQVDPVVRGLLASCPTMPATVIAQRIGWTHSLTILKDRVRVLRPYYLAPDPATRTSYEAGQRVQCDLWFPPVDVPLGAGQVGSPPVLVMVAGYSRMMFATMLPSRQAPDLIAGHWRLLNAMGVVPRELVWDNEAAVGSWRAGKPKLTEEFEAFRGVLGIGVHQCRPRDPEAKGLVERANGYLETSFLPGRMFTSPGDFNTQLADWLVLANRRPHRALGCKPVERWTADRDAMLALPPVAPQLGWRARVRLPRDHYVRLGSNDYSVDPVAVGRFVEVIADLQQVTVRLGTRVVAVHERCWARWQTITDPAHRAAALEMASVAAHRPASSAAPDEVEQRDLGAYDVAFGLTDVA